MVFDLFLGCGLDVCLMVICFFCLFWTFVSWCLVFLGEFLMLFDGFGGDVCFFGGRGVFLVFLGGRFFWCHVFCSGCLMHF